MITQLENYILQPCLTDLIYVIFRVTFFNFHEYLPMGVFNVYFAGNVAKVPSFRRFLSIGCATALPMEVAPEAIAEIFGYRLKRIDKLALYTSSCIICRLYSPLNEFSLCTLQAPESKTRWTCAFWQILSYSLFPSFFFFYTRRFSWYANFSMLFALVKSRKVYFGPCRSRGPLARAYK
jgi:hypothetical protein